MVSEIITKNFEETRKIGKAFAKKLVASQVADAVGSESLQGKRAVVIALFGELGSGKTTFTQGFAKGLGIEKRIISPTFIVLRTYKIKLKNKNSKVKNFYHIDLYRLESKEDIMNLGMEEILSDPQNIIVIEWAEKMGSLLPEKRIDVHFTYLNEKERKIIITH